MMTGTFEIIKDRVDITEAAERFGLQVKRNKALCIFHNDTHPSLSFKNNRFTCFACGEHGDVIDLVGKLTGSTAFEAAKQLNDAFHLGLELDKPIMQADITRLQRERQRVENFKSWEHGAFITVNSYAKYIDGIICTWKPSTPNEPIHPIFTQALNERETVNYILDLLTFGDWEAKIEVYKRYGKEVNRYKQIVDARNAGRTGT